MPSPIVNDFYKIRHPEGYEGNIFTPTQTQKGEYLLGNVNDQYKSILVFDFDLDQWTYVNKYNDDVLGMVLDYNINDDLRYYIYGNQARYEFIKNPNGSFSYQNTESGPFTSMDISYANIHSTNGIQNYRVTSGSSKSIKTLPMAYIDDYDDDYNLRNQKDNYYLTDSIISDSNADIVLGGQTINSGTNTSAGHTKFNTTTHYQDMEQYPDRFQIINLSNQYIWKEFLSVRADAPSTALINSQNALGYEIASLDDINDIWNTYTCPTEILSDGMIDAFWYDEQNVYISNLSNSGRKLVKFNTISKTFEEIALWDKFTDHMIVSFWQEFGIFFCIDIQGSIFAMDQKELVVWSRIVDTGIEHLHRVGGHNNRWYFIEKEIIGNPGSGTITPKPINGTYVFEFAEVPDAYAYLVSASGVIDSTGTANIGLSRNLTASGEALTTGVVDVLVQRQVYIQADSTTETTGTVNVSFKDPTNLQAWAVTDTTGTANYIISETFNLQATGTSDTNGTINMTTYRLVDITATSDISTQGIANFEIFGNLLLSANGIADTAGTANIEIIENVFYDRLRDYVPEYYLESNVTDNIFAMESNELQESNNLTLNVARNLNPIQTISMLNEYEREYAISVDNINTSVRRDRVLAKAYIYSNRFNEKNIKELATYLNIVATNVNQISTFDFEINIETNDQNNQDVLQFRELIEQWKPCYMRVNVNLIVSNTWEDLLIYRWFDLRNYQWGWIE